MMAVTHGSGTRSTSAYIGPAQACSAVPTFQASDIPAWMPVLVGKSAVAAVR